MPIPKAETRYLELGAVEDAAYQMVHQVPGGAKTVALLLGKSQNTVSNEVNKLMPRHKFGLLDAIVIMREYEDYQLLKTINQLCGFALLPLGRFQGIADMELLDLYSNWHAEIGDAAIAVREALSDGEISRAEFERIQKETIEANQASFEFLARLESLVVDDA